VKTGLIRLRHVVVGQQNQCQFVGCTEIVRIQSDIATDQHFRRALITSVLRIS
jgi:hypothetical protein